MALAVAVAAFLFYLAPAVALNVLNPSSATTKFIPSPFFSHALGPQGHVNLTAPLVLSNACCDDVVSFADGAVVVVKLLGYKSSLSQETLVAQHAETLGAVAVILVYDENVEPG
jgi:hypothetical protein